MPNEIRARHGSPTFYSLLERMADIHDKKSHDYASNNNPYGNYHFSGQLSLLFASSPEDVGFISRIGEKLYRLANLESSGKNPLNESIEDTENDLCVIMALWMSDRRDRRNAKLSNQKKREQEEYIRTGGIISQAGTQAVSIVCNNCGRQYNQIMAIRTKNGNFCSNRCVDDYEGKETSRPKI